jgi:RNA polymerase sigma factor (sigma-70 family)
MHAHDAQQLVRNEYAQASIRVKARQLCRQDGFRESDVEDIEQDLWLYLLAQAENFDPTRGSLNTYIDRLVNTAAAIMARSHDREMRADGFQATSLDTAPSGKDAKRPSLRSSLSPHDGARRTGAVPKSDLDRFEDQEALDFALASMPPDIRDVCQRVMDGVTPAKVARQLGVSRRRVRNMLAAARQHLERAGFGDS